MGEVKTVSTVFSAIAYSGFRFTWIGILISELGSESSLKSVSVSVGFPGSILWVQEIKKKMIAGKIKNPFPFILKNNKRMEKDLWRNYFVISL